MKTHLRQFLLQGSMTFMLSKTMLFTALTTALSGALLPYSAIASTAPHQQSPILIATAYTKLTLPTLRRGDRGRSVAQLQKILSDGGFLHACMSIWNIIEIRPTRITTISCWNELTWAFSPRGIYAFLVHND
jgi:hypothetical protein